MPTEMLTKDEHRPSRALPPNSSADEEARDSRWSARDSSKARVSGFVAPGFEEVRAEFERNFDERGEIGAAVAAYWRGEKVVDLWGGRRTPEGDAPWNEDTLVVFMSSTKGLAAMTLALANARGWLDYDAPVARYWPEFAQNGKADVTVRQLLGHEAGLVLLDEELRIGDMHDLDAVARVLARQKPAWPPGTRHGYHTMSLGLYMQELIRHVDPAHRTLGRFFHEEIALPLGIEFYIGLPPEIPDERLATVKTLSGGARALGVAQDTSSDAEEVLRNRGRLLRRSFLFADLSWNDRRTLEVELPAGNGVGTARAIARAYSAFAEGGAELGITPETFASITALPPTDHPEDEVIGMPTYFSLGFLRPGPEVWFGSSQRAFCAPGAGGSFAFADPDARLGYAYVMNKLDFYLQRRSAREGAARCGVPRNQMKVLVTAASKHGSTRELAETIARVLEEHGLSAELVDMDEVDDLSGYDAYVVGSGIYLGNWLKEARRFIDAHAPELAQRPTWLFASGSIVGEPPVADDPNALRAGLVERLVETTNAREHKLFAGKLDLSKLGLLEKAAVRGAHASEGDYRDWDDATRWATEIAAELSAERTSSTARR